MSTYEVSRRGFLAATGAAAGTAAAATAAAQESPTATEGGGNESEAGGGSGNETDGGDGGGSGGGGKEVPVFGSYVSSANLYSEENTQDARGQDEVSVAVGADDGYAFDPATIWVSPGTTIVWEWTGEGGAHNVKPNEGPAGFDSGGAEEGSDITYEYEVTEEDAGITAYKCVPHEGQGMKGGVAVGDDVETTTIETGGGGPAITIPDEALALTVATFFAMTTTLGLGYFFMKYGGDYEQP